MGALSMSPVLECGSLVAVTPPAHDPPAHSVDHERVVRKSLWRGGKSPQHTVVTARCEAEALMDRLAFGRGGKPPIAFQIEHVAFPLA